MNRNEHAAQAERLLESAKEVARKADRTKADAETIRELLDFSALHVAIARVLPWDSPCEADVEHCVVTPAGECYTHPRAEVPE